MNTPDPEITASSEIATDLYFELFAAIIEDSHNHTIVGVHTALICLADSLCTSTNMPIDMFCENLAKMKATREPEVQMEAYGERKRLRTIDQEAGAESSIRLFRRLVKVVAAHEGITPAIATTALVILIEDICHLTNKDIDWFCHYLRTKNDERHGRIPTGVDAIDSVLAGGMPRDRISKVYGNTVDENTIRVIWNAKLAGK